MHTVAWDLGLCALMKIVLQDNVPLPVSCVNASSYKAAGDAFAMMATRSYAMCAVSWSSFSISVCSTCGLDGSSDA